MIKIGITGNIACGKSVAFEIIKNEGYPIIDCDDIVKDFYNNKNFVIEAAKIFPQIVNDNKIDLKKLSNLLFSYPEFKEKYEDFIFPKVKEKIIEFFKGNSTRSQQTNVTLNLFPGLKNKNYTFVVAPLLFEARFEDMFDKIILISSNKDIRRKRLIARNSELSKIADKVIKAQIPEKEKIPKCNYVIKNNGNLEEFKNTVKTMLKVL